MILEGVRFSSALKNRDLIQSGLWRSVYLRNDHHGKRYSGVKLRIKNSTQLNDMRFPVIIL
ncbi:hypothetical protein Pan241w_21120 [Gimesia alba]|uniref:Uncharacterized protein n=1 Tax=Gimesia alba TaxID=2527973 RepID=A0A517RDT4_9PLAN|nr:hypothetical protein Pan241w_21120 [Gimesia alba]